MNRAMFMYAIGLSAFAGVIAFVNWQAAVTPALCILVICVDEICDALKETP